MMNKTYNNSNEVAAKKEIPSALQRQLTVIEELDKVVNRLENKLQPILRMDPQEKIGTEPENNSDVPLVVEIDARTRHILQLTKKLNLLGDMCEL